jgi:hypothetical protein
MLWPQETTVRRSFTFRSEALRTAIDSLMRWYGVPIVFLERDVAGRWVVAGCTDCAFDRALASVLSDQGLRATRIGGQIVIRAGEEAPAGATLAGTIVDSLSGDPLQGAVVILRTDENDAPQRWATTGASGFFSLRDVPEGTHRLQVRRVGYEPFRAAVTIDDRSEMVQEFRLLARELMQPHVTVEGRRSAFGAADGISRGVFIRSAPSDQHQYFLEGARIYHPVHFGGLASAFNGDALRDVQSVAGGVPPYYGGRIGGVMDLSLRTGSRDAVKGSVEIGSLGSGLVVDGPLTGSTTFVLSGRQRYPDLLSRFSYPNEVPSDLHALEGLFKVERMMGDHQRLSVSGYVSRDAMDRAVDGGPARRLENALRWKNAAASVRWHGVADRALLFSANMSFSAYDLSANHRSFGGGGASAFHASAASVQDLSLRAHAEYFYDRYHTMLGGVDVVRHGLAGTIDPFTSQLVAASLDGPAPWELSVYLQDQWRLTPSIQAEVGARATSFVAGDGASSSVDPRFSLMLTLDDDRRITGSISAVTQYLHPYRHSGLFLFYPSIFFYPTDRRIPPQTSLHGALGYEQTSRDDRYRLALETYGRVTRDLHEFAADSTRTSAATLADALLLGEGTSVGMEVTVDKRTGDLTGTLRYGFSWTTNRFAALNGGRPFQPRFDRRHEVYAAVTYALTPSWTLGALALVSSNHVPLVGAVTSEARTAGTEGAILTGADARYAEPFDLNGGRLPGFQRIELRASYAFALLDRTVEASLRMLNGYGLVDPFRWRLLASSDPRAQWAITYEPPPLLPLYPSLHVRVRF